MQVTIELRHAQPLGLCICMLTALAERAGFEPLVFPYLSIGYHETLAASGRDSNGIRGHPSTCVQASILFNKHHPQKQRQTQRVGQRHV